MSDLHELGVKHGTDKATWHRYMQVYETLLGRHRFRANNVLEIGMLHGQSLRVWLDWFDSAMIHGIDLADNDVEDGRLVKQIGNAYSFWAVDLWWPTQFDVIIDDGPHDLESMAHVVEHWSRRLAPHGTLVIEDIPDPLWVRLLYGLTPDELKPYAFGIDRNDHSDCKTREDTMFVIDCVGRR